MFVKAFSTAIMALVLILAFQNCGPASQQDVKYTNAKLGSGVADSGVPYDGKVYVLLDPLCTGGDQVRAKIIVHSATSGDLVRRDCRDITPIALGPTDFQINPSNVDQLVFQAQTFVSQVPNAGTVIDVKTAYSTGGFGYSFIHNFGTIADNDFVLVQSKLELYENGVLIGPAHSSHTDIANLGLGRYSHWFDQTNEYLRFSASDNSNPITNGRVYSFKVGN